jgi:hypothetical protein
MAHRMPMIPPDTHQSLFGKRSEFRHAPVAVVISDMNRLARYQWNGDGVYQLRPAFRQLDIARY